MSDALSGFGIGLRRRAAAALAATLSSFFIFVRLGIRGAAEN